MEKKKIVEKKKIFEKKKDEIDKQEDRDAAPVHQGRFPMALKRWNERRAWRTDGGSGCVPVDGKKSKENGPDKRGIDTQAERLTQAHKTRREVAVKKKKKKKKWSLKHGGTVGERQQQGESSGKEGRAWGGKRG